MSLNRRNKALIILLSPFVIGFLFGFLAGRGCSRGAEEALEPVTEVLEEALPESDVLEESVDSLTIADDVEGTGNVQAKEIIYYTKLMNYAKVFNDLNEAHLNIARKLGLSSIPETRAEVEDSHLVKIEDDDYLMIEPLRYSMPYLTKGGAAELNRIARAFSDSLASKGFPKYRLRVTSLLRTKEDVNRLRRSGNPNASENSAHCYGTTFDITYTNFEPEDESEVFMQPYELRKVLAEVLRDEKNAARCLVKYEKKEHCFHITSSTTR